ncbi:hypothetical protein, partial [Bacillus subtilis]|uniref:hypothetical protein n=1 Tax=Bacillus subtilis TaxID=1423 RepID=UPI0024AE15C1
MLFGVLFFCSAVFVVDGVLRIDDLLFSEVYFLLIAVVVGLTGLNYTGIVVVIVFVFIRGAFAKTISHDS